MACIGKTIIRLGVITGVIAGGVYALAGPDHVHALVSQFQDDVQTAIEESVKDPIELRSKIREMESELPKRIRTVRTDLANLQKQITELEDEKAIAERVVKLTENDLASLNGQVISSTDGMSTPASLTPVQRMSAHRVRAKINQVQQTRYAFAMRVQDATRDLGYLYKEAERYQEVLTKLETERAKFQAEKMQLERQIDSVARNNRLIKMLEESQATLDEMCNFSVGSLEAFHAELDRIRVSQEAELDYLTSEESQLSYEERARLELENETPVEIELPAEALQELEALGYSLEYKPESEF